MIVHRIIYRLDFPINPGIVDSPGRVMQLLNFGSEGYWNEFGEGDKSRALQAMYKSDQATAEEFRQFTVEPTSITLVIEVLDGIAVKNLGHDDRLRKMLELAGEFVTEFKLVKVKRSGVRLFTLDNVGAKDSSTTGDLLAPFQKVCAPQLAAVVAKNLGTPTDVGLSYDGEHEDGTKYHFRCGPYRVVEVRKYFENIYKRLEKVDKYNFICDLDIYEQDFEMKGIGPANWVKGLSKRVEPLLRGITASIAKGIV